ncbi:pneumococcal serine-rich repeat protein [Stomoxys calcitrans]|uniref:pneumococcal serine-rich repeat protein n=1 Tax=Stomoxys calcitrans TaxID=35570 RepID=UPI0027E2DF11|nr:pneumococcal serine-rich repeat protein [Stomoxys calcitrans]
MSAKGPKLGLYLVALVAILQIQVCLSQFAPQAVRNVPRTGSVSRATSTAREREYDYGNIEFTKGVANSRTITHSNGGVRNGGVTSVSRSNAVSRELELGGLPIGSTLTRSQTRTNGAVSKAVSHDLNVGKYSLGTTVSNTNNGFGLQRSADGGLAFGLGGLSFDLSRNNQPSSGALTQAQAQAQGLNARARANSNSRTNTQQYGNVGVTNTFSKSNAVSRTKQGQTSASTGGLAGGAATNGLTYGQGYRTRRTPSAPVYAAPVRQVAPAQYYRQPTYVRPRRSAQFIPFAYPGVELERPKRQFGRPNRNPGFGIQPQSQNANAEGLANNKGDLFEQQAGVNSQTNQEINEGGITQTNGASGIGSNLATDGSSGQVSSANVGQTNAVSGDGSQSSNSAQSQALNFEANQQQAATSNAGTNQVITATGELSEANSGSQSTNNNEFGSASNVANTNSAVFREGNTSGAQADSSGQSIVQGPNGQNSAANTQSSVTSTLGANGSVSNSATSNASAVSQGGKGASASASAVATASASSSAGAGGGNSFTNAQGSAGGGGAFSNTGAFANNFGAQGFANSKTGNRRG